MLQSPFCLQTFATAHLKACQGSHFKTTEYPVGAIRLMVAAVSYIVIPMHIGSSDELFTGVAYV